MPYGDEARDERAGGSPYDVQNPVRVEGRVGDKGGRGLIDHLPVLALGRDDDP